jgi:LEA14-like dessication related protein
LTAESGWERLRAEEDAMGSEILRKVRKLSPYAWLLLLCLACVTPVGFETPTLELTSVTPLPTDDLAQQFELGFLLRNPNSEPFTVRGMSYSVYLEGHKLLSGVTNAIPVVGPYEEERFTIIASTSLLGSLRLFEDLFAQPRDQFEYRLEAKLELSSPVVRKMNLEETGWIRLAE